MTDLDTRLRALADAASSAAVQPTTQELLARRRPVQRRWLPVGLVAAATAAVLSLVAVHPWSGNGRVLPAGIQTACPGLAPVAHVTAGGRSSVDAATSEVLRRVMSVVGIAPCAVRNGDAVDVYSGGPVNAQLVPSLLGEASVARVQRDTCPSFVTGPGQIAGSGYGNRTMTFADRNACVLVSTPEVQLDGHVMSSHSAVTADGSYNLTLALDDTAAEQLRALVASIGDRRSSDAATPDRVAILMGDKVLGEQTTGDITGASLTITGGLSAATSGMAVHLAGRVALPGDAAVAALGDMGCGQTPVAYRLSGGSLSSDAIASLVRSRLSTLTTDSCLSVDADGSLDVHLGAAGRLAVSAASFRRELFIAPVLRVCGPLCDLPPASSLPGKDGTRYVIDESKKIDLDGHLVRATAGLLTQSASDWLVNLEMDAATTDAFGALTSRVVSASSPGNQLAVVMDGMVLSAPVIQSPIPDGNAQISGDLTEAEAEQLAAALSAPSLPRDVTIDPLPGSSAS